MSTSTFSAAPCRKELAEVSEKGISNAKLLPRPDRFEALEQSESYLLIIRTSSGDVLFQTDVASIHQAFRRLIDWSVGHVSYDGQATISGPNGFCTFHLTKTSSDFAWIEDDG